MAFNLKPFLNQTAVHWVYEGPDGYGGVSFSSASPVEIAVRWADEVTSFINDKGEEEKSKTGVLSEDEIGMNDYLYLGNISDLDSDQADNPMKIPTARRVKGIKHIVPKTATPIFYKAYFGGTDK